MSRFDAKETQASIEMAEIIGISGCSWVKYCSSIHSQQNNSPILSLHMNEEKTVCCRLPEKQLLSTSWLPPKEGTGEGVRHSYLSWELLICMIGISGRWVKRRS